MTDKKSEILILGGGPAGLAAAAELDEGQKKFTLVEKSGKVGGLAKTYKFGDFRTDNGPHRFFSKNDYLYKIIKDLLGEQWIKVDRFTRFYINGKFFKYPIEVKDTLTKLGFFVSAKAAIDYIFAKFKYYKRKPANFEEYVVATFGRTLAELNLINYTEKIWGLPCSRLSVNWAEQRIKGLNIWTIVKSLLKKGDNPKSLVDQFYYPEWGTGTIYEKIKKRIEKENDVILRTVPLKITHKNGKIKNVILSNGNLYHPDTVVSSIPITTFISLLDPLPQPAVLSAAKRLRYRSQVYLFITLNQPRVSKDQWIYFPDKDIPFGRISEMKNFSDKMSPRNKTSLFVEFFCWEGDEIWNMDKNELLKITTEWLEKLKLVKRNKVIDCFHIKEKYVYPVYDLNYQKNLNVIKKYLDRFSNLIYIGRPGRFKYTNQDHSLEMGILAARSIIEDRKLDVEDVGSEREYFEKGNID